jgi:hypothetical protein
MQTLWRAWLVWLMVLAVPLQGLAGTAMQHCATAPPTSQQRSSAEAGHAEHTPGLPAAEVVHQLAHAHPHGHAPGAAIDASGRVTAEPTAAPAASGDHHCSACAACCSALGLPTRAGPLTVPRTASAAAPLPPVVVDSFVPAGLERPPRSSFG